ncbi:hypothetical protein ONS95_013341 [Cadophora gregata]|uniref:uncharacterized protein n=1 Tax=Cadophora gregata TaxID=51156 RepID=UPI0026DAA846|nr:uncharacterized protein ONS95_013341 [Cadophora gregata]KAK0099768.1 hypothetical protein ONS96_008264 [Cadophora gregata f. sp. sojae]KAK0116320.1 hypothetical protein ONS95_013341 [Cadophora gregata]
MITWWSLKAYIHQADTAATQTTLASLHLPWDMYICTIYSIAAKGEDRRKTSPPENAAAHLSCEDLAYSGDGGFELFGFETASIILICESIEVTLFTGQRSIIFANKQEPLQL